MGQSGRQIAEELHGAGREVYLALSTCREAPRRYLGHNILYWLLETGKHGRDYGINVFPAARFAPNPLPSGTDGSHNIHLRELGRRGMHPARPRLVNRRRRRRLHRRPPRTPRRS
ncbi:hypothetical protein J2Y41_001322 [Arthrobacter sp. 1088]|uniref:hypothetical protein n=1 Tax=Arthrobacter sp. 1088 TaxID=2817768 RepID=UPI002865D896|nr:hypothetical protein [Arthrobacter sp. 1088]MDR6685767.1 hypothetical protein [Arthrobacter sp. 1088]